MRRPSTLDGHSGYACDFPSLPSNDVVAGVRLLKLRSKPPTYMSACRMVSVGKKVRRVDEIVAGNVPIAAAQQYDQGEVFGRSLWNFSASAYFARPKTRKLF